VIAYYTIALESRNGKGFRRVTEEGYSDLAPSSKLYLSLALGL